jgi:GTP-binding protein HflX
VDWLKQRIKTDDIDVVVLNDIVNSGQLFRLEKELWEVNPRIVVWDRVDLILNIFDKHATSTEAKLQIELAKITHMGPRIYGLGGTVLSRQGGGIGTRGLGETNLELERRKIKTRREQINKQLRHLVTQKENRLNLRKEQGVNTVALVGYTSAGKTTLFNALSAKDKLTHQSLFTTLDTVVGKLKTGDRPPILVSDTIGFIDNLPPLLIEAFQTTLMESIASELLLHVIDISDPQMPQKIKVVDQILNDLGVTQTVILIFNKIDTAPPEVIKDLENKYPGRITFFTCAATGTGIAKLKEFISNHLMPANI